MRFWDSSALISLVVEQSFSRKALAFYKEDSELVVWWGSRIEFISAISRLERESFLDQEMAQNIYSKLDYLSDCWFEVQPGQQVRELAERLLRVHALRSADALQLAAALVVSENKPRTLDFICFDKRLNQAALKEGLNVLS